MAYSNAIFYLDYTLGSDAARANIAPTVYANNGAGLVRVTVSASALVTGGVVDIAGTTSAVYDGAWIVTVINPTTVDLQGSVFTVNPAAKGTCTPRGGCSWADAWKTKYYGGGSQSGTPTSKLQAGDTIRMAKSADPVSLGVTGKWTENTLASGTYVTKNVSATANNGSGLIRITTSTAHGYSTGDVVQIVGLVGTIEANGAWLITVINSTTFDLQNSAYVNARVSGGTTSVINSKAVVLSAPLTKNVTDCEVNWTGANDGTPTVQSYTTDAKEGSNCIKVTMDAATQTNKLQAYFALGGTIDFSAYQELSFWFKNSAIMGDTTWYLALCSDIAGATVVDTFPILANASSINFWMCRSVARVGGGNLGAAIQSVALYSGASAPVNSSNVFIDNIIACATGSLNLTSLIGKNQHTQTGTDGWYTIQSISPDGYVVLLDNGVNRKSNEGRGYSGSSSTETLYQRETLKLLFGSDQMGRNGTASAPVLWSGGWDTASTTQNGMTALDSLGGNYNVWMLQSAYGNTFAILEYFIGVRGDVGYYGVGANGCIIRNCGATGANTHGLYFNGLAFNTISENYFSVNNGGAGISIYIAGNITFTNLYNCSNNGGNNGMGISLSNVLQYSIKGVCVLYNNEYAMSPASSGDSVRSWIQNVSIKGSKNQTFNTGGGSIVNILNATIAESVAMQTNQTTGMNPEIRINNLNATGYAIIYHHGGKVEQQASTLSNGSGKEWKFSTDTYTIRTTNNPIKMAIATIAVNSGSLVTVKAWFKKGHATNIGAKLVCPGGQIAGVASDVVATKASDTLEEELTITFTPSEAGVVSIEAWAYYVAGHSTVIVDAMTITQA